MNPVVSFIVPVFNVEKYLDQCVSSILSQTYSNIEVILVDDGSTDNSGSICDSYAEKDKRVRVIHKKNGGLSSARNAGLEVFSGDYVVFTDSDDFVSPDMAQTMLESLDKSDSDLVMCGIVYTDEDGNSTETINDRNASGEYDTEALLSNIASGWTFGAVAWNKLYKEDLFKDNLRFVEGKYSEDEFMAHRMLARVKKAVVIQDVLCYYRQRSGSIINSVFNVKRLDSIDAFIDRTTFFESMGRKNLAYISLATAMRNLAAYWPQRKTSNEIHSLLDSYRVKLKELANDIGRQKVRKKYVVSVSLFTKCFPLYLLMRRIREAL